MTAVIFKFLHIGGWVVCALTLGQEGPVVVPFWVWFGHLQCVFLGSPTSSERLKTWDGTRIQNCVCADIEHTFCLISSTYKIGTCVLTHLWGSRSIRLKKMMQGKKKWYGLKRVMHFRCTSPLSWLVMLLLLLQAASSFAVKNQMEQIATNSEAAHTPDLDLAASSQLSSREKRGNLFCSCVIIMQVDKRLNYNID